MNVRRKSVHGVGVNDADYTVAYKLAGRIVRCPIYNTWAGMLLRCYSSKWLARAPSYSGCAVTDDWLRFSQFRLWMLEQDWEGKSLDKDILIEGNKVYSPDACVFVDQEVNKLLTDSASARGYYPLGVDFIKRSSRYRARIGTPNGSLCLGYYGDPYNAHFAWQQAKLTRIVEVAERQEPRVKEARLRRAEVLRRDMRDGTETTKL